MTYQAYDRRIRWHPCINTTSEIIPGYALMALDGPVDEDPRETAISTDFATAVEGETVWRVTKPTAAHVARDDSALLVANGPLQIPPGRYGRCSWDWPLQLLHDGKNDAIGPSNAAGAQAGSWYAWRRSFDGPLTCLGHDPAQNGPHYPLTRSVHTAWFTMRNVRQLRVFFAALLQGNYYADEILELNDIPSAILTSSGTDDFEIEERSDSDSSKVLLVKKAGLYEISYSVTVQGPDAPSGGLLYLDVMSTYPALSTPVSLSMPGVRASLGTAYATARENVATSGVADLAANSQIWIQNVGAYEIGATYGRLLIRQLAPDRGVTQG